MSNRQIPRPQPSPLRAASNNSIRGGTSNPNSKRLSTAPDVTVPTTHNVANVSSGKGSRRASLGVVGTSVGVDTASGASTLNPANNANPNPQQKARAKDLLRKHYGLGVGPPPPRPVGSNSQDPMDMNSSAFDAKSYYEQLITTSTLPSLLKRENELLSAIRQLEGERQSLVYNHHHELIAASDTISAMKTRAESLDGDLDLLRVAFSEISRLTSEVSVEQNANAEGTEPR